MSEVVRSNLEASILMVSIPDDAPHTMMALLPTVVLDSPLTTASIYLGMVLICSHRETHEVLSPRVFAI